MTPTTHRRLLVCTFLMCFTVLILFYKQSLTEECYSRLFNDEDLFRKCSKFLVNSWSCKIPDLEPFSSDVKKFYEVEKYFPCRKFSLLTYITKNNTVTLHINTTVLPLYCKNEIICSYANITRNDSVENPDTVFGLSEYTIFTNNVTLSDNFIVVECKDFRSKELIYENTHAVTTMNKHILKKVEMFANKTKPLSVLIIGMDSISRLNFIRTLPKSHKFLMDNDWIALKGYNKIADNTFPNLMAILTGFEKYSTLRKCHPNKEGMLNKCPLIWNDFKNFGYITAYAEDESWISTFNHEKKGFKEAPTDYYYRPYILKTEQLKILWKDDMKYCTGPETTGERMLNIAKDFAVTFKNSPNFGLFWMNSFSHNSLNAPTRMDDKVEQFLEDITLAGVLDNSMVIILSDHGLRVGKFLQTAMGWLEERLPFIYIWLPQKFKKKFPVEYSNLSKNVDKLTSPYDLHMTLQHLLVLSNLNYQTKPSTGCPNCRSLFTEIESERSCQDAGISPHWCTCAEFGHLGAKDGKIVAKAAYYLINQIQTNLDKSSEGHKCNSYVLEKIVKAGISQSYKEEKYFLLIVQTNPKAMFEATIAYYTHRNGSPYFELAGEISRIDRYEPHSKCTHDTFLKKYCYCKYSNASLRNV